MPSVSYTACESESSRRDGQHRCRPYLTSDSSGVSKRQKEPTAVGSAQKSKKATILPNCCISRESNTGPVDGNDGFYH
jgi:hypothetical protein